MTMKVTGRKASLYATAMAISLVALSGTAHAQSASNGTFVAIKHNGATVTKEAKSTIAKPVVAVTADVQAQAQAEAAVKTEVTTQLLAARSAGTVTAFNNYAAPTTGALAVLKAKQSALATATTDLADAEEAKIANETLIANLQANKASADAAVATASANLAVASVALTGTPTQAQIDARAAAIAQATAVKDLAEERQTVVGSALSAATGAQAGILQTYTTAITTKATKEGEVLVAQGTVTTTKAALDSALLSDTTLASALTAVNSAAGTSFAATYEGLVAIAAYDDAAAAATYGSNGYTRAVNSLTAAAASSNTNIALASGALTSSTAALEAGANFETEVLSVLVNHEDRIVANTAGIAANTTAIAALDVRTTTNTTAIAALDVRTTANTTAIANEVTARVAADNALGARITTETNERIAADNVLRDQIASSTATAIAMGGAALLPDMGFTLSGNVAVYEGAQAMALNAAAKVGANAFVTASVGGGLNKNGSVGGRVGFVFGF